MSVKRKPSQPPATSDLLDQLLDRWEEARSNGRDESVESLCEDCPELIDTLASRIRKLQQTDWLLEPDPTVDTIPLRGAMHVAIPETVKSREAFLLAATASGVLKDADLESMPLDGVPGNQDARSLASYLVDAGKLTVYQASVLLTGDAAPLCIDRFRVLDQTGAGGMGIVYRAVDTRNDTVVALKLLPKHAADSPEKVARFRREAEAAQRLEHPHIVTAFDAGDSEFGPYLVMEFVEGFNLDQRIRNEGTLTVATAVEFIRQAALALTHAHSQGVVHRDVKPSNLIVTPNGVVKVADFGLARLGMKNDGKHLSTSVGLTTAGAIMGTAAFMAPEQALDTNDADPRSDIYSLGVTLYYLLNGETPYKRATFMKTVVAHRESALPSLCALRDDVPPSLDRVFRRMVDKRPAQRYQSVDEFLLALETATRRARRSFVWRRVWTVARPAMIIMSVALFAFGAHYAWNLMMLRRAGDATSGAHRHSAAKSEIAAATKTRTAPPPLLVAPFDTMTAQQSQQAWADFLEVPAVITNELGMELRLIPAGVFQMGASEEESELSLTDIKSLLNGIGPSIEQLIISETPGHRVKLSEAFYASTCEVTVGMFQQFADATGYVTQAERDDDKIGKGGFASVNARSVQVPELNWRNPGYEQSDQHPVVLITWNDAEAFCSWLSKRDGRTYRLPSEAQWEYLCRAGIQSRQLVAEPEELSLVAHFSLARSDDVQPQAVGALLPNAFGLYDMLGNAREWCHDWYDPEYYSDSPGQDPVGPRQRVTGAYGRVIRGGGLIDHPSADLRPTFRYTAHPYRRYDNVGFRVVTVHEFPSSAFAHLEAKSE